jgi:hypothetical protein
MSRTTSGTVRQVGQNNFPNIEICHHVTLSKKKLMSLHSESAVISSIFIIYLQSRHTKKILFRRSFRATDATIYRRPLLGGIEIK